MSDKSTETRPLAVPSNRFARLGRLSGMTAGIAGNMAVNGLSQLGQGQRPSMRNLLLTPQNISRVAEQLAQMRGAAMKIGQLVSMDTGEVLPPELAQIMARLRDDAHFMPPAQLKQVLNRQWPDNWLKSFKRFDVRPIAAASIGQVHRAQLKDGRDLAIKVQYPGVARSIDSDVANVGVLMRMSGLLPRGFAVTPYLDEARKQLHEETDYAREADQLDVFQTLLATQDTFRVPQLYRDWSTPEILAMEFVAGTPIETAATETQDTRNTIVRNLLNLTLDELFTFGIMQTDPNFANYRYDADQGRIILLDFGATRRIDPLVADQYRRLLRAGLKDDIATLESVAREIGFLAPETSPSHCDQILQMMSLVFSYIRQSRPFDFSRDDLSKRMQAAGMTLAESGFVPPPLPLDILLLQRKFGGMFLLAKQLGTSLDLKAIIDAHL